MLVCRSLKVLMEPQVQVGQRMLLPQKMLPNRSVSNIKELVVKLVAQFAYLTVNNPRQYDLCMIA